MSDPIVPMNMTTKPSVGGIVNTLNPLSFAVPGQEYVPKSLIKLFQSNDPDWNKSGAPAKTAHLLAKIVGGGAVLGAAAWGLRHLMHSMKIDAIQGAQTAATSGQKLSKIYKRPTSEMLSYGQKEQKQTKKIEQPKEDGVEKKALLDPYRLAYGAIPPAAVLLAMAASYKAADKHYDKKLSKKLDSELGAATAQRQAIAKRRILRGRGVQELLQGDNIQKQASSLLDYANTAAGAAAMLIAAASMAGGYHIGKNNDKNYAKYKAYKKGLQEYNKARLSQEPAQSKPLDPKLVALYNANLAKGKRKVQDMPQVDSISYRDVLM